MQQQNKIDLYLDNNKSYLTKINSTFYFCLRHKNRVLKYSLKTKNLRTANQYKIRLFLMLKDKEELHSENFFKELTIEEMVESVKYEKLGINNAIGEDGRPLNNDPAKCAIDIKADVGDNPEALKRIRAKILRALAEESEQIEEYNIRSLDLKRIKLNIAIDNFISFQETRVGKSSLKSFKATCSWLSYFTDLEKTYVDELTEDFFKDMNEKIKNMPKYTLTKHKNSKYENVIAEYENKDYERLSPQQINKNFAFYKNKLYKWFIYQNYTKKNVVQYISEKEIVKHFEEFTEFELKLLRSEIKDMYVSNMIKLALYTGMRNDDIYNIKIEDINLEEKYLIVPKSKTTAGKRIIPIHPEIIELVHYYYEKAKYDNLKRVFIEKENDTINAINKRLNKEIAKLIPNKTKRFHALRKNCIQKLYELQQEEKIQENTIQVLAGHKVDNITFDIYNRNKVHIDVLRKAINQIEYNF